MIYTGCDDNYNEIPLGAPYDKTKLSVYIEHSTDLDYTEPIDNFEPSNTKLKKDSKIIVEKPKTKKNGQRLF